MADQRKDDRFLTEICPRHSQAVDPVGAEKNRAPLDPLLAPLPRTQAGKAGHTCAYCAYEKGYQDALTGLPHT